MRYKVLILILILAGTLWVGFRTSEARDLIGALGSLPDAGKTVQCAGIEMSKAACLLTHAADTNSGLFRQFVRLDVPTLWDISYILLALVGVVASCFLLIFEGAPPKTLEWPKIFIRCLLGSIFGFICYLLVKVLPGPQSVSQLLGAAGAESHIAAPPTAASAGTEHLNALYARYELLPVLAGLFLSQFYHKLRGVLDFLMKPFNG